MMEQKMHCQEGRSMSLFDAVGATDTCRIMHRMKGVRSDVCGGEAVNEAQDHKAVSAQAMSAKLNNRSDG